MSNPFLDKDGFLNTAEVVALAKEIDKLATKEGLKVAQVHYSPKLIPKYDALKEKANPAMFKKKRAQIVKQRRNMPVAGSRIKMIVLLREYKDLPDDFNRDIAQCLKAFEIQTKRATAAQESAKAAAVKLRDAANRAHDKALVEVEAILNEAGLKETEDYVLSESPMGKSMVVCLGKGLYVSIGKADEAKFEKALEGPKENPLMARKKAAAPGKKAPAAKAVPSKKPAARSTEGKVVKKALKPNLKRAKLR